MHSEASEKFITPVTSGEWTLETFQLSEAERKNFVMRQMFRSTPTKAYDYHIKSNKDYIRLCRGKEVWMSDTPMEMGTCMEFMTSAHGKVFVAGLGIGVTLLPVIENPNVEKIVVAELDQNVIDIWEKASANIDTSKVEIHNFDCHEPEKFLEKGEKFDTLWFDIWVNICADNYPETKELYKKYRKYINYDNENRYVGFWMRDYIKEEYHRDQNGYW